MEPHEAEAILNSYHMTICDTFCKATCGKWNDDYKIRCVDNGCVANCCKPMAIFSEGLKEAYRIAEKKIYKHANYGKD